MIKVTAIFDIGKTNKKLFLFDSDYQEVYREYVRFKEIEDEDGFPTENLEALQNWLKEVFTRILKMKEFSVKAINFSSYGASFVHLDENGEVLTPLYNYTKPYEANLTASFYKKYGPESTLTRATGSPNLGMLNSGMQLYWLKHRKPEVFAKIKYSLHLPQYLSYIFTGIPLSEYTSIGCHTSLWDYAKKDYHDWLYQEGIHKKFPPIVPTETSINLNYNGKRIKIGVGIHDSSSALIPYVRSIKKPFLLVSTGTWSITLNPFSQTILTEEDLAHDCINFMRINGKPIKASRLFLGNEYKYQVQKLADQFKVPKDYHKTLRFNPNLFLEIIKDFEYRFRWVSLTSEHMPKETKIPDMGFERAYHQLMTELVLLQVKSIHDVIGTDKIEKLYVDGGFTDNEIYIKLLSHYLRNMQLRTTNASLGSALGAAIALSDARLNSKFLKKNYSLTKHVPYIIK